MGGVQAYLTGAVKPTTTSTPTGAQELQFWMGQGTLDTVKDDIEFEVMYSSNTGVIVTARAYAANVAVNADAPGTISGTSGDSNSRSHISTNLIGKLDIHGSGRMMLLKIDIPIGAEAKIAAINYRADLVPWNEKAFR